ncbi:MAG: CAP domain-containing protein [Planctomycetaceae bacterium]|nr:CAP domain-containing protein [Planctomycetaceae bacterium]
MAHKHLHRASPALIAVCAICLGFLAGCGMPGDSMGARDSDVRGVSVRPQRSDRDAVEAFRLVNDERARRGMQILRRRADLDAVAYTHARDLMRMNKLDHTSSDGRQLEHRLAKLDWEWAGENLARNKGYASPAAEAVQGWIASPRHYENMFRPDYSQTGMAALYDPDSGFTYFVQVFIIPAS